MTGPTIFTEDTPMNAHRNFGSELAERAAKMPDPVWRGRLWARRSREEAPGRPDPFGPARSRQRLWSVEAFPTAANVAALLRAFPEKRGTIEKWESLFGADWQTSISNRPPYVRVATREALELLLLRKRNEFEAALAEGGMSQARHHSVDMDEIEGVMERYPLPSRIDRMMADAEFTIAVAQGQPHVECIDAGNRRFTLVPRGEGGAPVFERASDSGPGPAVHNGRDTPGVFNVLCGAARVRDGRQLGFLLADMAEEGIEAVEIRTVLSVILGGPSPAGGPRAVVSGVAAPRRFHAEPFALSKGETPAECLARVKSECSALLMWTDRPGHATILVQPLAGARAMQRFALWDGAILASYAPGSTTPATRLSAEVVITASGLSTVEDAVAAGKVETDRVSAGRLARFARALSRNGVLRDGAPLFVDIVIEDGVCRAVDILGMDLGRPADAPYGEIFRSIARRGLMRRKAKGGDHVPALPPFRQPSLRGVGQEKDPFVSYGAEDDMEFDFGGFGTFSDVAFAEDEDAPETPRGPLRQAASSAPGSAGSVPDDEVSGGDGAVKSVRRVLAEISAAAPPAVETGKEA